MSDHKYVGPVGQVYPGFQPPANQPEPGEVYDVPVSAVRGDQRWERVDAPKPRKTAKKTAAEPPADDPAVESGVTPDSPAEPTEQPDEPAQPDEANEES